MQGIQKTVKTYLFVYFIIIIIIVVFASNKKSRSCNNCQF